MKRAIASILLLVLGALSACAATGSPAAGKWNCVSTSETGMEVAWTLSITDEGGKLSGSVVFNLTSDKLELIEPALNGKTLTFKIQINPTEIVTLTGTIDGSKIEGTFKGKDSGTGTFKGTRQPSES